MLKLNYNSKVTTSRNVGKKDLVNGYNMFNFQFIFFESGAKYLKEGRFFPKGRAEKEKKKPVKILKP
jgi:hypothetical protein